MSPAAPGPPPDATGPEDAIGRAEATPSDASAPVDPSASTDTTPTPDDERWMRRALRLARAAAEREEVPVGAVLVGPDGPVAEDHNRTRELADPTAHAEMLVLRRGGEAAGDWRLDGHTLYATLEPCAMCAGALVLARVGRLVFAARDPKAGMCGSLGNLVQDPRLNHRVEVTEGVLAARAAALLREFFRARR